ncbi:MAG: hypothetical protein KatS3mg018_2318 [Fimbriimonadales bacterium]|nr:MAG: hypothetical protein KatS3mg018_2318 [Fimbriimonadales bacterium]
MAKQSLRSSATITNSQTRRRTACALIALTIVSTNASFAQLTLPYSGSGANTTQLFQITQNGTGITAQFLLNNTTTFQPALLGQSISPTGTGVLGRASATSGTTNGVYGWADSPSGRGVFGTATATSGFSFGVWGQSSSPAGTGVYGVALSPSGSTYGGRFEAGSFDGTGVYGVAVATSGVNYGVVGRTNSPNGYGGYFVGRGYFSGDVGIGVSSPSHRLHVETDTGGRAIFGDHTATSGSTYGVYGASASPDGRGVYGIHTATTGTAPGVHGVTDSTSGNAVGVLGVVSSTSPGGLSTAVRGINNGTGSTGIGVWGSHAGSGWGVYGTSVSGIGVYGEATATSGATYGVWGQSASDSGMGVFGEATATSGATYGVYGISDSTSGTGVYGWATATSGTTHGVYGVSDSTDGTGVFGYTTATSGGTYGMVGQSDSALGTGVYGWATATSGATCGVRGTTTSPDSSAYGVVGQEPNGGSGHAMYAVGTFAATGTKSFQIDHPLRPETHYLNHFCAEGPEPYNLYRGNITTDAQGYAVIQLPDYFEAINRDPTYHLTVIDASDDFVQAKVVREIQNNQFVIRTSKPFVKVSWRVEAVRNDPWVQRYGFQSEQEKSKEAQGKYLNPELYGQPKERGIFYHPDPEPAPNEPTKP